MSFADVGASLFSSAASRGWDKVPGLSRVTHNANRFFLRAGARPIQTANLKNGAKLRVDLRAGGQWQIFYARHADAFWVSMCDALLDPEALFLDIGANIGMYAVQIGAIRRRPGQVHAFEPMPANIARLRENVALNGLEDVVTVYPFGLSDAPATLQLAFVDTRNGEDTGNAEIVTEGKETGRETFSIEVQPLDTLNLPDTPIGSMKIDVEGHEDFAYAGGAQRLAKDRPFIVAEYNRVELASRGLGPEHKFNTALPPDYVALRQDGNRLAPLTDWMDLHRVTNFLACPAEKLDRAMAVRV